MKTKGPRYQKGFTLTELLAVMTILVVLAGIAPASIFKSLKRASLAQAINNAKQVKLSLDAFAIDFDGQYPNDDTADYVIEGGTGETYSNDYFRQMFLAGVTESEKIFWVKNSAVASKFAPDDKVKEGGRVQADEVLQKGDVHWAYITDQTNLDTGSRPLILDGYKRGTSEWDPNTWDQKVIVLAIDGSCRTMGMRASDGKVLDGSRKDILSAQADAWDGEDPTDLLKQPWPGAGVEEAPFAGLTSKAGKKINATLVGVKGDKAVLKMSTGFLYRYPISDLDAESQKRVREFAAKEEE
jgi:prepilin-type N-terminal cleavage/methylation domain-containing protein